MKVQFDHINRLMEMLFYSRGHAYPSPPLGRNSFSNYRNAMCTDWSRDIFAPGNNQRNYEDRYLSDTLCRYLANNAAIQSPTNLSPGKLDDIVQYLELNKSSIANFLQQNDSARFNLYKAFFAVRWIGYSGFVSVFFPPITIIKDCWWSIARANYGNFILCSPVEWSLDTEGECVEMKGRDYTFVGQCSKVDDNVAFTLRSPQKMLFMALKRGKAKNPKLLRGTFAGFSTDGIPICGVELFLRAEPGNYHLMNSFSIALPDIPDESIGTQDFVKFKEALPAPDFTHLFASEDDLLKCALYLWCHPYPTIREESGGAFNVIDFDQKK